MFRTEFSQNFVAVLFVAGADDASAGLDALDCVGHYRLRKLWSEILKTTALFALPLYL